MLEQKSPDLHHDATKISPFDMTDTEMEHLQGEETKNHILHKNMNIHIIGDQQKPLEQKKIYNKTKKYHF